MKVEASVIGSLERIPKRAKRFQSEMRVKSKAWRGEAFSPLYDQKAKPAGVCPPVVCHYQLP
jgi:hypothetical protein